jgi:hypothetical protein
MRQRLAEMQQRQEFSEWGFVSDHEIRSVRELKDKILLRLNAPKGSILHVPNNAGQFELFLSVPPDLKVILLFIPSIRSCLLLSCLLQVQLSFATRLLYHSPFFFAA